jgi:Rieske Fe-S protein
MSSPFFPDDPARRNAIAITCGAAAVGGAAVAIPFVSTFQPSERAKAAGAPVEVDISSINPGELKRVEWRGKPVWIVRRTKDQLSFWLWLEFARIWAVHRRKNSKRALNRPYPMIGQVAFCALVMALLSTWRAVFIRISQRLTI